MKSSMIKRYERGRRKLEDKENDRRGENIVEWK